MDPVSITIATLAAGGISAFGQMYGASAKASAADYQARVARANADIAGQNAKFATEKGNAMAMDLGLKDRYNIGVAKATQGASGIAVDQGSAALARDSMGKMAALDQGRIRNNAAREAFGYGVEEMGHRAQAGLLQSEVGWDKTAGYIGAAGSILGSAASAGSKWMEMKKFMPSGGDMYNPNATSDTSNSYFS